MSSTAAPTAQPSTTPVHDMVHEDEHHDAITRIVAVALDHSHHSQHALEWAVKNILVKETDLVILVNTRPVAVVPGPYGSAYMDFSNYIVQLEEQTRSQSHALLRSAALKLKQSGFVVKAISLRGDPREELTRKVEELNVDLLVIGSRGLGSIKRMFIGSVSDHLIHHVHCPVVIVKDSTPVEKGTATVETSTGSLDPVPAALH